MCVSECGEGLSPIFFFVCFVFKQLFHFQHACLAQVKREVRPNGIEFKTPNRFHPQNGDIAVSTAFNANRSRSNTYKRRKDTLSNFPEGGMLL